MLDAFANLTCTLSAGEGKTALLSAQQDVAEAAKQHAALNAARDQGGTSGAAAAGVESAVTLNARAALANQVNVFADAAFYVDVFRGPLDETPDSSARPPSSAPTVPISGRTGSRRAGRSLS